MANHGTRSKYTNEKCRCEECTTAHKAYMKKYSEGRFAKLREARQNGSLVLKSHGTFTSATAGCPCEECRNYIRDRNLKKEYGISIDEFNAMLDSQGGNCAICGKAPSKGFQTGTGLVVDHDHASGRVRGLLCTTCNTGLGKLGDTKEAIQRALDYLS